MKKSFFVMVALSLFSYQPVFVMETLEMFQALTLVVSSMVAAHPELAQALERNAIKVNLKPLSVDDFPHQPNQHYRVKKTQQPHARSRRQFTQHHK